MGCHAVCAGDVRELPHRVVDDCVRPPSPLEAHRLNRRTLHHVEQCQTPRAAVVVVQLWQTAPGPHRTAPTAPTALRAPHSTTAVYHDSINGPTRVSMNHRRQLPPRPSCPSYRAPPTPAPPPAVARGPR
ncbi:hypothetical protein BS50DRAFT_571305 [Corynespora cassiicola Philippines]|uniref:Uncharacterized protein n=1 Tax=Corynespora cassiicola Philippines TaxID=1448308 RepID=A0A2T2NY31_CORCC|nr:hypothetical protein BS50DRAFT_571305 [Corynespora cassiicola Philippines]